MNELVVAYDVTAVINGRTGIARYVTELGSALEHRGTRLRRFAIGRGAFEPPPDTRRMPVPARAVRRWWRLAPWPTAERLAGEADLVHATGLLIPPTRRPLVVTVHDVAAVVHPELHPARHRGLVQQVLAALPRAAAVVAVSQATADDLLELGMDSERLFVAPLGFTALPEPAPLPGETPAPGTYLLTVGETSPRKGYDVVLRALAQADSGLSLVMAGPPAGDEARLQALVNELGLDGRVVRLQSVSDGELASLYRGAVALCFPSIAEGFGLPVLEAMAAGLPVIASALPITRELALDAAVFVERRDPALWAQAIRSLVSEPAERSELAQAGRERARAFSWETTAAITEEAYKLALSSPAGPFESARSPSSSAS